MADIDRRRAGQLMREAGLDGLVLFQPEAFQYAVARGRRRHHVGPCRCRDRACAGR